jgi:hypothetical protein
MPGRPTGNIAEPIPTGSGIVDTRAHAQVAVREAACLVGVFRPTMSEAP